MNDADKKSPTFEEALAELEAIVRTLESGDVSLEEALGKYEAGVALLKRCYGQLKQAEQRIAVLSGEDEEGKPIAQVFETGAVAEPDSRRRPRRTES